MNGLKKLKFDENIDFILSLAKSQYSNSGKIANEKVLADSGYGQGEVLVNPIHMASIYSAFANDGNMIKPYLEVKENNEVEYLVEGAFTAEVANTMPSTKTRMPPAVPIRLITAFALERKGLMVTSGISATAGLR